MLTKVKNIQNTLKGIMKDEKGGPGLEEAVLLVFVGLIVANAADSLGDVISQSFTSATNSLKDALGIS